MKDWNGREITCAHSQGGVVAVAHPLDNLISTDCSPWPTPEILQKLYQSPQIRAFSGDQAEVCTSESLQKLDQSPQIRTFSADQSAICTSGIGYYCDLQSIHSEDAITWSVFGTVSRSSKTRLAAWLRELFTLLDLRVGQTEDIDIFLWRRIPHPDTLGPGGPEIDVGISTADALILVEAKWQSRVGAAQGEKKDKDQIQLRGEFLKKYGSGLFPDRSHFAVIGVSLLPDAFENTTPEGVTFRSVTWEDICSLPTHPLAEEVQRYFKWKKETGARAGGDPRP